MARFKVGDRVRVLDSAEDQFTAGNEYTARYVTEHSIGVEADDGGNPNGWAIDLFELVHPTTAPIRTVTRRGIVPGGVGLPNGTTMHVGVQNDEVSVHLDEIWLDAESLREAAALFTQFAEVLEENSTLGKEVV